MLVTIFCVLANLFESIIIMEVVSSAQANEILSSFDDRLRHYATKQLTKVNRTDRYNVFYYF